MFTGNARVLIPNTGTVPWKKRSWLAFDVCTFPAIPQTLHPGSRLMVVYFVYIRRGWVPVGRLDPRWAIGCDRRGRMLCCWPRGPGDGVPIRVPLEMAFPHGCLRLWCSRGGSRVGAECPEDPPPPCRFGGCRPPSFLSGGGADGGGEHSEEWPSSPPPSGGGGWYARSQRGTIGRSLGKRPLRVPLTISWSVHCLVQ